MVGEDFDGDLWFWVVENDEDEDGRAIFGSYGSLDSIILSVDFGKKRML
jgi:hypothetical protein